MTPGAELIHKCGQLIRMGDLSELERLAERLRQGDVAAESDFRAQVHPLVRYIVKRAARAKDGTLFDHIRRLADKGIVAEDGIEAPTLGLALWESMVTRLICDRLLHYLKRQPPDDVAATIWSMLSGTATDLDELS